MNLFIIDRFTNIHIYFSPPTTSACPVWFTKHRNWWRQSKEITRQYYYILIICILLFHIHGNLANISTFLISTFAFPVHMSTFHVRSGREPKGDVFSVSKTWLSVKLCFIILLIQAVTFPAAAAQNITGLQLHIREQDVSIFGTLWTDETTSFLLVS